MKARKATRTGDRVEVSLAPVMLGAVAGTANKMEVLTGCINGGTGCDAETSLYWKNAVCCDTPEC